MATLRRYTRNALPRSRLAGTRCRAGAPPAPNRSGLIAESARSGIRRRVQLGSAKKQVLGALVAYNTKLVPYNDAMSSASEHIMTVSQNGQVSIPAATRARWKTRRVVVVDLGDRVVVRPLPDQPVAGLEGKYKGRGPSADEARRRARRAAKDKRQ